MEKPKIPKTNWLLTAALFFGAPFIFIYFKNFTNTEDFWELYFGGFIIMLFPILLAYGNGHSDGLAKGEYNQRFDQWWKETGSKEFDKEFNQK